MKRMGGWLGVVLLVQIWLITAAVADQSLLEQGVAAFKAQNYGKAVELLGTYLKEQPQAVEARRYRAQALVRLERQEDALAEVEAGLQDHPKDTGLLLVKGGILGEMGRRDEAIQVFTQVLQVDPKNAEALKERGVNLANEGRVDEAMTDLNQAVKLLPKDPWVFNHRGMVFFCQNNLKAAVADFSTAIKLSPDLPHAYFFRGNLYRYHLNQPAKALADFKEGCRLGHPLCCQEAEKAAESEVDKK
jgi:tetratricopeptide (TPR) repeat protein